MQKAWNRIKQEWEEDPVKVLVIASLVATAAAKLIEAGNNTRNSHAWKKEVNRRDRMTRR